MALPTTDQDKDKSLAQEAGSFGAVAIKLGFINPAQLEEAMRVQAAAVKAGLRKRVGEILMKKGYLTPEQFQKVLKSQTVDKKKKVGEFELISKLGEGGMGSVFKARQISMDRIIALKILSPKMAKNREFRDRFEREARAVAKLNHPNIVSGIDVGMADGYCYFAMEFVDGDSLGQYMSRRGGKLPEAEALEFVRQTALALHHAHQNDILHRDVKPDNILLDKGGHTAKLVDLGLARSSDDDSALTQAGQAVGTPFYISPEQARGRSDLTPATDLYSLGATLFHLLTGQVPFDGPTAAVIMTRHLTDPVPSPRSVNSEVSLGADRIVMKLMEKQPADRYKDAQQVAKDIERVLQGDMLDRSPSAGSSRKPAAGKAARVTVTLPNRDRDEKESPSGGSGSSIPTRVFRRRRRQQAAAGLGGAIVLIVLLGALLFFAMKGSNTGKPREKPAVPQPPPTPTVIETPRNVLPPPPGERLAPAVPATLQSGADGRRVLRVDFEGRVENFEVDPLVGRADQYPTLVADAAGKNHVLRLGTIRQPYRSVPAEKESSVMVRLLFRPDTVFSPGATLTVSVHFSESKDQNPELRVYWDNKMATMPRAMCGWSFRDPAFKTGWGKVQLQLDKAPVRLKSTQSPDSPQYISFAAGDPEEKVEVYLDDLELVDGNPAAAEPPVAPKAAPEIIPEKEAPVVPTPKKKAAPEEKEPPVVPPPKKAVNGDAVHQAL